MHSYFSCHITIVCLLSLCCELCLGWLFYPLSSTYGIFAAIAVPLDLLHRNVFVSYNFEANYNLPDIWGVPPIYKGAESDEDFETARQNAAQPMSNAASVVHTLNESSAEDQIIVLETTTQSLINDSTQPIATDSAPERPIRSLLSRTNIYKIIISKLESSGFEGESCLLRLICEVSATELGDVNGVLGSLLHVIFSPSTSEPEQLPLRYYQAEHDGWFDHCQLYENACRESLLDLISQPFGEIITLIERNSL